MTHPLDARANEWIRRVGAPRAVWFVRRAAPYAIALLILWLVPRVWLELFAIPRQALGAFIAFLWFAGVQMGETQASK